MGHYAVDTVTKGEKKGVKNSIIDVDKFLRFLGIWFITIAIMFGVLVIVAMVNEKEHFVKEAFKSIDSFNLFFSLALSAFLEQLWNDEIKNRKYKVALLFSGLAVALGVILYVSYSVVEITSPDNPLIVNSGTINTIYIIYSEVSVMMGFIVRSLNF